MLALAERYTEAEIFEMPLVKIQHLYKCLMELKSLERMAFISDVAVAAQGDKKGIQSVLDGLLEHLKPDKK